jgi:hypothetical protein
MLKSIRGLAALLVAAVMLNVPLAGIAEAKKVCMGPGWANAPASGKAKLQADLRKNGSIGPGDTLAACTAPSGLGAKPNPQKFARCMKDCDTLKVGMELACSIGALFIPGMGAACALGQNGANSVCPLTCERKYGG